VRPYPRGQFRSRAPAPWLPSAARHPGSALWAGCTPLTQPSAHQPTPAPVRKKSTPPVRCVSVVRVGVPHLKNGTAPAQRPTPLRRRSLGSAALPPAPPLPTHTPPSPVSEWRCLRQLVAPGSTAVAVPHHTQHAAGRVQPSFRQRHEAVVMQAAFPGRAPLRRVNVCVGCSRFSNPASVPSTSNIDTSLELSGVLFSPARSLRMMSGTVQKGACTAGAFRYATWP
jgi:hypothetical protein